MSLAFREVSELQFEKPTSFPPLSTRHSAGTGYAQAPVGESMKRPWSESRLRNPDVWFDERDLETERTNHGGTRSRPYQILRDL